MSSDTYEIYAVRYAHHHRMSSENFLGGDPHDVPMPLDYFVWAAVGAERTVILDTGFDEAMAKKRGREFLRPPGHGLAAIGVGPAKVRDVAISHMHYDHAGNSELFPTRPIICRIARWRSAPGVAWDMRRSAARSSRTTCRRWCATSSPAGCNSMTARERSRRASPSTMSAGRRRGCR